MDAKKAFCLLFFQSKYAFLSRTVLYAFSLPFFSFTVDEKEVVKISSRNERAWEKLVLVVSVICYD